MALILFLNYSHDPNWWNEVSHAPEGDVTRVITFPKITSQKYRQVKTEPLGVYSLCVFARVGWRSPPHLCLLTTRACWLCAGAVYDPATLTANPCSSSAAEHRRKLRAIVYWIKYQFYTELHPIKKYKPFKVYKKKKKSSALRTEPICSSEFEWDVSDRISPSFPSKSLIG